MGGAGGHDMPHTPGMGNMHEGPMMENMNLMMDHMSQMMQEMHSLQAQMAGQGAGHGQHMADTGHMTAMLHGMSGEIDNMMPHLDAMLRDMRAWAADPDQTGGANREQMQDLMKNMDSMMQAGVNVMSAMHALSGIHDPAATPAGGQGGGK